MTRIRVMPALLLNDGRLVKTTQFGSSSYIGSPLNTVKIFNDLMVDEIIILDIGAAANRTEPDIPLLAKIAENCSVPMAYGGGVRSPQQAREILSAGFEKIIINSAALENSSIIEELSDKFGCQAVIAAIDAVKLDDGSYCVSSYSNSVKVNRSPLDVAKELEHKGAGEILLTSVNNEGTWRGFDLELTHQLANNLAIPLIAHGGGGSINHIVDAINLGNASAIALGNMLVYRAKDQGVLVNFPSKELHELVHSQYELPI